MSGLEALAISGIVGGTGLNFAGNVLAAGARADAARAEARLKHEQASELLERQTLNEQIMIEQAQLATGEYQTAFSASGRGGGGLGGALRIKRDLSRNIMVSRREAQFKADQLRKGADIETDLASSGLAAAWLTGFGNVIGAAPTIANELRKKKDEPGKLY